MTPVHRIAKGMAEDNALKAMQRDTYEKLLRNEAEAQARAKEYKKCRTA